MVFKGFVKEIASSYINKIIGDHPFALRIILDEIYFDKWCEKAAVKCNEIDVYLTAKGHKITRKTMTNTVEELALGYAKYRLEKAELSLNYEIPKDSYNG